MPRHPSVYARMLRDKMQAAGANCWLVNTGWSGGQYGVGRRMDIKLTRAMLRAALAGQLDGVEVNAHPDFGVLVPANCPDVPREVLDPRATWGDAQAYDRIAHDLVKRFENNFKQFEPYVDEGVLAAGIYQAAAE